MTGETQRAGAFVQMLEGRFGNDLRCALLYGSAARGGFREGRSDLNVLVLLRSAGPTDLLRAVDPTREWVVAGNPPPLILSEAEWKNSVDVFPIEYSDIRDAHVLLKGDDPFLGIRIDRNDLRLQLEHELRSKKIQLREGFLAAGSDPDSLGPLVAGSLSTFLTLFRAILRLAGEAVPAGAEVLIQKVSQLTGFDPDPVLAVLDEKVTARPGMEQMDGDTSAGYLLAIEHATEWLDGYTAAEGVSAEI